MDVWQTLGISPTADKAAIRHAYAQKTRACHPEDNPAGFAALHEAYSAAMHIASQSAARGFGSAPLSPSAPAASQADPPASVFLAKGPERVRRVPVRASRPGRDSFDYSFLRGRAGARARRPACAQVHPRPVRRAQVSPRACERFDYSVLGGHGTKAQPSPAVFASEEEQSVQALIAQFNRLAAQNAPDAAWQEVLHGDAFEAARELPRFKVLLARLLCRAQNVPEPVWLFLTRCYPLQELQEAAARSDCPEGTLALMRALAPAYDRFAPPGMPQNAGSSDGPYAPAVCRLVLWQIAWIIALIGLADRAAAGNRETAAVYIGLTLIPIAVIVFALRRHR